MRSHYYERELDHLRRLAAEFSRAHPALAPLLSGPSSDPDVERLLEGTAFLTGLLSQKLDESYTALGERLTSLVLPQLLQDIPSCTILRFVPKPALAESAPVPKGSEAASVKIDGTACIFTTAYPVELHPLRLAFAGMDARPGQAARLRLDFELRGLPLDQWKAKSLRLHLAGPRTAAANRLAFLCRNVARIRLAGEEGEHLLPAGSLAPVGFGPDDALFPYPPTAYPGFRLLREYYVFPEKFFFFDILNLDSWTKRGNGSGFSCTFEMREPLQGEAPPCETDDFVLFATPALNLFPYDTSPIQADHRQTGYRVRANTSQADAYCPCQVLEVRGVVPGTRSAREYSPRFAAPDGSFGAAYTVQRRVSGEGRELFIALQYPPGSEVPETEILSLKALYSNGALPERLKIGDVCVATASSPSLAEFANLSPPSAPVPAPAGGDTIWPMLAHLHLNYLPLAGAETLRALLSAYLPQKADALSAIGANKKRIESIVRVEAAEVDRLWKGRPVRGTDVTVTLDESGFGSAGGMYFFSMVLACFLQEYAAINSFVRVRVTDTLNRNSFQWQERQGRYFPL